MDKGEIEDLIVRNQANLFAFLLRTCGDREIAEDVMQETFVKAIRSAESYRPIARMTTWLFQIALNIVRDRWRRRTEIISLEDWMIPTAESAGSTEETALDIIEAGEVRKALIALPVEQRTAVIMAYYHDLSYLEIAQIQGCPLGTVKSRIHNGLIRLERLLTGEVAAGDEDRGCAGSR